MYTFQRTVAFFFFSPSTQVVAVLVVVTTLRSFCTIYLFQQTDGALYPCGGTLSSLY